jgi:hypothetical protein
MSKKTDWSGTFWADWAERVASSAIGGVLTMLGLSVSDLLHSSVSAWLAVVGIPTATSALKGLLANLADDESGPSLLPAPPAPVVEDGPAD